MMIRSFANRILSTPIIKRPSVHSGLSYRFISNKGGEAISISNKVSETIYALSAGVGTAITLHQ